MLRAVTTNLLSGGVGLGRALVPLAATCVVFSKQVVAAPATPR